MTSNANAPFNWISQQLFDSLDSVNNIRLGVFLESGLSGTPNENMGLSNTPTRLSIKLKDNKSNNKMDIELSYTEVFILNTKLPQLFKKSIQNFKIDVFSKQKKRTLSFSMVNNQAYVLAMSDNSSIAQSLQFVFGIEGFLAFGSLIKQVYENWILSVFNLNAVTSNHRIITDLNKLNESVARLQLQKSHVEAPTVKQEKVKEKEFEDNYTEVFEKDSERFNLNIFDEIDIDLTENKSVEEKKESIIESSDEIDEDDCPFDVDTIVSAPATETIVIDDSVINEIDLESKENTIPKTIIRKVIQPRPFMNNFMEWNLDNLFNWISAFSLVNETSNDLSFKPLELILSKSIGLENAKPLLDSSDFNYMNYHILTSLKDSIMTYIEKRTGKFEKTNKFFFKDIDFITKENNKELWDFIVDIAYLDIIFKYYNFNINKFDIKISDVTSTLYNIKLANCFIDSFASSLIKLIDTDSHEILKTDINNLYLMFDDKDTFDILSNCYNFITKGGTFKVELSSINKYMDKYIETISAINTTSDNFSKLCEINDLGDIKSKFITTKSKENELDKSTKLFLKALNLELIDDSKYSDIKNFVEIEELIKSEGDSRVVNIVKILKTHPEIKKVSELQRLLNSSEVDIEVDEPILETVIVKSTPTETLNKPIDMFSIDDDDDEFDIFALQNVLGD